MRAILVSLIFIGSGARAADPVKGIALIADAVLDGCMKAYEASPLRASIPRSAYESGCRCTADGAHDRLKSSKKLADAFRKEDGDAVTATVKEALAPEAMDKLSKACMAKSAVVNNVPEPKIPDKPSSVKGLTGDLRLSLQTTAYATCNDQISMQAETQLGGMKGIELCRCRAEYIVDRMSEQDADKMLKNDKQGIAYLGKLSDDGTKLCLSKSR